jgi:glycosyltransferase involved in cell wall biosynthesis
MATVDVIIPAYNAAKYLPAALESVGSQTFKNWQIVLVDDGSTDNTAEVVAPFLDRFGPRMRYIKQENHGMSAARNTAVRSSTSEYIALLDADDVWMPCRLSASLEVLAERPKAGLAYGQVTRIDPEGGIVSDWLGNLTNSEGSIAPHIYMRTVELPCPTITVRRRCLDDVGLFDETMRATEDRDLWLRIALRHEIAFVPKIIACYRASPGSMSTNSQRMFQAQLQFIRKHYGAEGCGLRARQFALARAYKQRADALNSQYRPRAAFISAIQAVILYPLDWNNFRTAGSLLFSWIGSVRRH